MTEHEVLSLFFPTIDRMNSAHLLQQETPLLAHYTSITALEKILDSNELWFSNPLFMNDLEEVRFGFTQGRQVIYQHAGLAALLGTPARCKIFAEEFLALWNAFEQQHALDVYVFCLSEHRPGDLSGRLSMWRGYGGYGKGAALVFNTKRFKADPSSPLFAAKVSYGTQQERVQRFQDTVTELVNLLQAHPAVQDQQVRVLANGFFLVMLFYALTTKDQGFDEEHEWRVVYMPRYDVNKRLIDHLHYMIGPQGVEPKLRFPIKAFPTAPEQWVLEDIVEHIIIGPSISSPLAASCVARMLDILRKPQLRDRVVASRIPLRPM